jgi:hypothetical protein
MRPFIFVLPTIMLLPTLLIQDNRLAPDKPEAGGFSADVEKLVQTIATAKDPDELGWKGYRLLFQKVGPDGIRDLLAHPKDGIAIHAAWELVTLTVPERETAQVFVRPDTDKLNWFLGFLEGRARVTAPRWWAESLLNTRANRRNDIYPGGPKECPYHRLGLNDAQGPHDTSLRREQDRFILRIGNETVTVPKDLLRITNEGEVHCNVSALITASRCFVAVHGDAGYAFQLASIDRDTGKVHWKSEVFGTWWNDISGVHHMWVTVTEQDKRIVLFGAASTGMHVEVFRPEDGANLFRFSTSYSLR